ncbi:uncharacterized protein A4U43_C05F24300 [Asparagus officinalis]|uniref:Uncharacterized protein n=1 Tax=Asparagus officinalis TaxID=4686 RepID=A0A5P1EUU8_ASPOF|nr:uncharacterized protein A4U43_C05F24300 [Asparagus officinalis]
MKLNQLNGSEFDQVLRPIQPPLNVRHPRIDPPSALPFRNDLLRFSAGRGLYARSRPPPGKRGTSSRPPCARKTAHRRHRQTSVSYDLYDLSHAVHSNSHLRKLLILPPPQIRRRRRRTHCLLDLSNRHETLQPYNQRHGGEATRDCAGPVSMRWRL